MPHWLLPPNPFCVSSKLTWHTVEVIVPDSAETGSLSQITHSLPLTFKYMYIHTFSSHSIACSPIKDHLLFIFWTPWWDEKSQIILKEHFWIFGSVPLHHKKKKNYLIFFQSFSHDSVQSCKILLKGLLHNQSDILLCVNWDLEEKSSFIDKEGNENRKDDGTYAYVNEASRCMNRYSTQNVNLRFNREKKKMQKNKNKQQLSC